MEEKIPREFFNDINSNSKLLMEVIRAKFKAIKVVIKNQSSELNQKRSWP